jgi:hypoxanthine phosphoribosyltransferase
MSETLPELDVLISQSSLQQRISELATAVTRDYRGKNPLLIGTLKGGFVFLAHLALKLEFDVEFEFVAARSYNADGTSSGKVDLFKNITIDIRDRHLLIVEDVVDSGLTLSMMLADFELVKPASVAVIALLNKKCERKVDLPIKYVGFDIDDRFVIGFGMDYNEKYRNLPYIGVFNDKSN